MEYNNFKEEILYKMKKIDIELTEKQIKQFYKYMNLLIEWNNKINLTAITEPKEIILKHFVSWCYSKGCMSNMLLSYIKPNSNYFLTKTNIFIYICIN